MPKKNEVLDKKLDEMTPEELKAYVADLQNKNEKLESAENERKKQAEAEAAEASGMTPEKWLDELVSFQAFKDNDHYKDDIVVWINGNRLQIPRGKLVMIPRKYYLAMSDAERQGNLAADVQIGYEEEYEGKIKPRFER